MDFDFCCFCLPGNSFGQTKGLSLKAAETEYSKNYYAALVYYNNVLEFDKMIRNHL